MMRLERSRLPVLEKKMGQPPPTRRKKVYLCAAARGKTLSRLYLHTSCARYNKFVFPEISKRYLPTYFQTVLARGNLAGQIGRWERPSYAVPIKMHSTGGPVAATTAVDSHGSSHQSKLCGYAPLKDLCTPYQLQPPPSRHKPSHGNSATNNRHVRISEPVASNAVVGSLQSVHVQVRKKISSWHAVPAVL